MSTMKNWVMRWVAGLVISALMLSLPAVADQVTYYHNDALGSPVVATDSAGQVLWREGYRPYGQRTINDSASAQNQIWFTGKQEESGLGVQYFGARWYHPDTGRFLSIDPVGVSVENLRGFNRFAYANNNPYVFFDPDGRDAVGIVFKGYPINTGLGFNAPLGHAGVLLINNSSGLTKYYEYGRYDPNGRGIIGEHLPKELGNIRKVDVPNVTIGKDGLPTEKSLENVYKKLSKIAGKGGEVDATYHRGADFKQMEDYVRSFSGDKNRQEYSVPFCNCYDFKSRVINAGKKRKKDGE